MFFNDTATTEIYTLSLHDALPIWVSESIARLEGEGDADDGRQTGVLVSPGLFSEEAWTAVASQ